MSNPVAQKLCTALQQIHKIEKQRIGSKLRLRDLKNRTTSPTPHPWYQVHMMKTFNKRNQMHKYGVVYINRLPLYGVI